jgi:hypothetical protein
LIILAFFHFDASISHCASNTTSFATLSLLRLCKTSLAINIFLPYLAFFFYFIFCFLFVFHVKI